MTQQDDSKIEIKIPLERWVEDIIDKTIEKHTKNCPVAKAMYDNGKPGIFSRMNKVEFWAAISQWTIGIFTIQLIIFVFWAIKAIIEK